MMRWPKITKHFINMVISRYSGHHILFCKINFNWFCLSQNEDVFKLLNLTFFITIFIKLQQMSVSIEYDKLLGLGNLFYISNNISGFGEILLVYRGILNHGSLSMS